jgi:hypothetical protein
MQLQGKSKYVTCYKITRIAFAVGYSLRYYCGGSQHQKLGTPLATSVHVWIGQTVNCLRTIRQSIARVVLCSDVLCSGLLLCMR